ncbi:MAG: hypothetical protein ABS92_11230 [Thiobacillus sp. SCN 63-374]|nr:MAG: hypothetical protein ABS92_11230 [Thiobacillus sp. SCN 63-374]
MEMTKSFAGKAQTAARLNTWRDLQRSMRKILDFSIRRISSSEHPRFDALRAALIIADYPFPNTEDARLAPSSL